MIQPPARPFLKWAGGKTQLLPQLLDRIPGDWYLDVGTYHEPFVGGGAMFFGLRRRIQRAVLSDSNQQLIQTYMAVRDRVEDVIELLRKYARAFRARGGDYFYELRNAGPGLECVNVAAWLIFMNHTCFNGLYRVNKSGKFNVPYGRYKNPTICDEKNLLACSRALAGVELYCADFRSFTSEAYARTFYFDPPYWPVSKTSNFTGYTGEKFAYLDQMELATIAIRLRNDGAQVMLSQGGDRILVEQYRRLGFRCDPVRARRNINCRGAGRGTVREYIIT